MRRTSSIILLVFGLLACSERPFYEEYQHLEAGWHQDSVLRFAVPIEDTLSSYSVMLRLRGNDQYPYANLYLFRSIQSDRGLEYRDTANLTLADPYGKWLGEGIGELKTFSRAFRREPMRFNRSGVYTFEIQQAMRRELLPGLEDVGLSIYRNPNGEEKDQ